MASEQIESLFGDLRSAVASHHVLAAHEIAKSIYSLDRAFHAEAVTPYLQSHPVGDGAMTRDTLVRLEQFKGWGREMLVRYNVSRIQGDEILDVFNDLINGRHLGSRSFYLHNYGHDFHIHASAGFDIVQVLNPRIDRIEYFYVLRAEWRDALWAVLDERGLL